MCVMMGVLVTVIGV